MADFSIITQSPQMRAIVQQDMLSRQFHDGLFPSSLFRGDVRVFPWPKNAGDTIIQTAKGLMQPAMRPLLPGADPVPKTYALEQWEATIQKRGSSVDVDMNNDMVAIASIFLQNAHQLGLQAAQTLNRVVRNRMYNAAESGWTVADGAQSATTSLRVKRINGFTKARNPTTSGASNVRFSAVSSTNPLSILVDISGTLTANTVTGFTPDNAGDEYGPGVLTLGSAATVSDRAAVLSLDRSYALHVGGGNRTDDVGSTDLPKLSDVRATIANFWQNNVPSHADARFHCHMDPVSMAKVYEDPELQRLNTSMPDWYMYKDFFIGEILNTVFARNPECPIMQTVYPNDGTTYSVDDDFAPELYSNGNASTGVAMHRMLFSGAESVIECYRDAMDLISDAGLTGKTATPSVTNNGIEVMTDRVQLIFRAPLDRLQSQVSISWLFIGDWPVRTDAATGNAQRYKRLAEIIHGE